MRPILLKGHERALTRVKYNADGDLLFSAAKDPKPTVWYADTGVRLGTFNGHQVGGGTGLFALSQVFFLLVVMVL